MRTREKTVPTDVSGRWQKSDFSSKHMEGLNYDYGRGWRMTKCKKTRYKMLSKVCNKRSAAQLQQGQEGSFQLRAIT